MGDKAVSIVFAPSLWEAPSDIEPLVVRCQQPRQPLSDERADALDRR